MENRNSRAECGTKLPGSDRMAGYRMLLGAAAVFTGVILTAGCGILKKPLEQYSVQYLEYFDTITSITICTDSEKKFEEYKADIADSLQKYHRLFDIYNDYDGVANVKTINDNAGVAPVTVDQELFDMLEFAADWERKTGGRVNIAMGSVLAVWHDFREAGLDDPEHAKIPDMETLKAENLHTDLEKLQMDRKTLQVYLPDEEMRLDVGAVAKGYATHQIALMLREQGVTSALLSLGGNVETIGTRPDGKPWRVGIQNPDLSSPQSYLHVVELKDRCMVTSGVYQRFYEADGVRYHHIIHPDTLMPWNEYQSVSILTDDSGIGDVLSTAVFNMKLEEGQALVESLPNVEAMWILANGTEVYSAGFREYMSE